MRARSRDLDRWGGVSGSRGKRCVCTHLIYQQVDSGGAGVLCTRISKQARRKKESKNNRCLRTLFCCILHAGPPDKQLAPGTCSVG